MRRRAKQGGHATIHSPEALNRAFGPDGFLRRFDLRGELGTDHRADAGAGRRHDWICPPEFSEEIARLIPQADLRVFEHSSHSIRER